VGARVAAPRVFVRVRERALLPGVGGAAGAGGDLKERGGRERGGKGGGVCVSESEGVRGVGQA